MNRGNRNVIRRLEPEEAEVYVRHRFRALTDSPFAFSASPEDDLAATPETVREMLGRFPETVIFGAFDGEQLVGSVGIYRDPHRKLAHKTHLWGMYVEPSHRGRGLGRGLLGAAVDHARAIDGVTHVHLVVGETIDAARRIYEAAGFRVWGTEPDALWHDGKRISHHHMVLAL